MCKICSKCQGVMNYDPYFEAEICGRCGFIERTKNCRTKSLASQQAANIESAKKLMYALAVH